MMRSQLSTNRQILLANRPESLPTEANFELVESPIPTLADGQILVRVLLLSIDAAMRGWVLETPNYSPAVPLGSVMRSFGIAEVVESRSSIYRVGDVVAGMTGWQEYGVLAEAEVVRTLDPASGPLSPYLGVLGVTGLTAWVGMMEIGKPKPGSTVVVSTAAGATGSAAGQLAAIHGARTVGLTGSDEKVRICLEEFGYDECINYKTSQDLSADLAKACPDGIDVYFDSVGGQMLDAVLANIAIGARIAICGTISMLANDIPVGRRIERILLVQRALVQGYLTSDHFERSEEIATIMAPWVESGRLRYREDMAPSLQDAPGALTALLTGENLGKSIVRVAYGAGEQQ